MSKNAKRVMAVVATVALVSLLCVCLVACNRDDYANRLTKKGYNVVGGDAISENANYEWSIIGTKSGDSVTVTKYKTDDAAKEAEASAKKLVTSNYSVKRSGKIVIKGTPQGVKDAQ